MTTLSQCIPLLCFLFVFDNTMIVSTHIHIMKSKEVKQVLRR